MADRRTRKPAGAGRTIARVRARERSAFANANRLPWGSDQVATMADANALGLKDLLAKDDAVGLVAKHADGQRDLNSRMAGGLLAAAMVQRNLEASSATCPGWLARFGKTLRAWSRSWL